MKFLKASEVATSSPSIKMSAGGVLAEAITTRICCVVLLLPLPPHPSVARNPKHSAAIRTHLPTSRLQLNLPVYQKSRNSENRMRGVDENDVSYWLGATPANVKFTVICVSTSTGLPFRRYGRYFHCLTASIAADARRGSPEMSDRFWTVPSFPIIALSITDPCTRAARASGGYVGLTLLSIMACETPCEMR